MQQYFMNRYAMSEQGAINLRKAIISHTVLNLSKLCPPMVGFLFISQYLGPLIGISDVPHFSLLQYGLMIIVMLGIMYVIASWDYTNLYTNVYQESAQIRIDMINRLKQLPMSYFSKRDISDLAATVMDDTMNYETIFSHSVPQFYSTVASTIIISLMMTLYHWKLALAALWVIPLSIIIFALFKTKHTQLNQTSSVKKRAMLEQFQENIDQVNVIKAYNQEDKLIAAFNHKLSELNKSKLTSELTSGASLAFSAIILKLGIVSTAIVSAQLFMGGEINLLVYIGFLILTMSLYLPIEGIITFMMMMTTLDTVVNRIKDIKTMPIQSGQSSFHPDNYDIKCEDVHFGYGNESVIDDVSFTAKQGDVTALIGPSGSGKTTLTKLIARFWDIDSGKIFIGNQAINEIDPDVLLEHFSIIFQDVHLFNASIKDNIAVGKHGATDEEIKHAANIARCDELIKRMPDGIDSLIGENGMRLSGGERQRISIARAILKDAPIILMDEATASLDVQNETLIQQALSALIKDKTIIVIAHRLRTIREADKIVLMNDGRVQAIGTDDELMQSSDLYRRMLQS